MTRAIVMILTCAFLLGPFGLGSVFAWTDHHRGSASHHGTDGKHPYPEGLPACGAAACAPAATPIGPGAHEGPRRAERLPWIFVDDRALRPGPFKQDPPVPRPRA